MISDAKLYKRGIILKENDLIAVLKTINRTLPNLINKHFDVCEYINKDTVFEGWLIRFNATDEQWIMH